MSIDLTTAGLLVDSAYLGAVAVVLSSFTLCIKNARKAVVAIGVKKNF